MTPQDWTRYENPAQPQEGDKASYFQRVIGETVRLGSVLNDCSYQGEDISDMEAWTRFDEMFRAGEITSLNVEFINIMMTNRSVAMESHFAARWVQQAMPVVELGHKLAAALLCSTPHPSAEEFFQSPWKAWIIRVPPGLIHMLDSSRQHLEDMQLIKVYTFVNHQGKLSWNYIASSVSMHIHAPNILADFIFQSKDDFAAYEDEVEIKLDQVDMRAAALASRLIRGCTMMLVDPVERLTYRQAPGMSSKTMKNRAAKFGKGASHQPHWIDRYVITAPVKVDLRETVRKYMTGERASPSVQSLVRGHWRAQAHGAKRLLRKMIWIEPHFRGDETLPIATRPHVLRPGDNE
jgi:hypothetical protein